MRAFLIIANGLVGLFCAALAIALANVSSFALAAWMAFLALASLVMVVWVHSQDQS